MDDTFLFTSGTDELPSKTKLEHLKKHLKNYRFFAKSQLVVTKEKTEYIVFSTRKRLNDTILNVDNEKIAESNSMKYLGLIVDNKLNFDGEVKKRKAMRIKQLDLSKKITFDIRKKKVLTDSFFAQAIPNYNSLLIID